MKVSAFHETGALEGFPSAGEPTPATSELQVSVRAAGSNETDRYPGSATAPRPDGGNVAEAAVAIVKAGFGGGCHWCTEGVFQVLRGVAQVAQGFVKSDAPADTWSEGVIVTFDPSVISLATLSEVHLRTHSATRFRSPRSKYRSAIYIFEDSQRTEAELAITRFAEESGKTVHTQVLPFASFTASEDRYQNYYRTDPGRPFCRRYIDPKLDYIRKHFTSLALPEATLSASQAIHADDGS